MDNNIERKEFSMQDLEMMQRESMIENYAGEYIPEKFWSELGKNYINSFTTPEMEKENPDRCNPFHLNIDTLFPRIYHLSPRPERILELGCGFGRVLGFLEANKELLKIKEVIGVEFSPTMIERSNDYFSAIKPKLQKNPQIIQGDITKGLPMFEDNSFDLVYTHVCLTHIPPKHIPNIIKEIERVSKRYVIHIERFRYEFEHPSPHRWSHHLAKMYNKLGWDILNYDSTLEEGHHTKVLVLEKTKL